MPQHEESIVVIRNLHYAWTDKPILKGINLTIPRGKVTAIMGPSGIGKSTLLRLIGGQMKPSAGQLTVNGLSVPELSRKALRKLRRKMGLLFQEGALFTDLNVFENVAFLLREHTRLPEDMIHDLVLMKLEAVGLRGAAKLRIDELSGGMARRVALARAVMLDPELMMYDEPFTGQDPINRGILLKLIRQLNDAFNMTSIVVSHDVSDVVAMADSIYVIVGGVVIASGTPKEVINNPALQIQQFVQGLPDGPVPFQYPAINYQQDFEL